MHERKRTFSLKSLFVPLTTLKVIHIIVALGFIVFSNALFGDFLWDDILQVTNNFLIHSLSNISSFFSGSTFVSDYSSNLVGGYYKPLLSLSFATIYSLFGAQPFFFHLIQLTLHILNVILLFILLKNFFKIKLAFLLSLAFLIHPINVEAAVYISALQEPLFFFFGILATIFSIKEEITFKRLIAINLLLLSSLLSKETGILFLFIIPLYRIIFRKKRLIMLLISEFTTLLLYFFMRFFIGGVYFTKLETTVPIRELSLGERLINIPSILFYYLKTFFIPINLAIDQLWVVINVDFNSFYLPLFVVLLFVLFLILLGRLIFKVDKKAFHVFIFFFLWFLVGLFIHIQIFPLDLTVADRWFYFSFVGLLGILGMVIRHILLPNNNIKTISLTIAVIILLLLSIRTMVRNTDWSHAITLYTHDSKVSDNFDIENLLGGEYFNLQKYDEALAHYKKSAELLPHGLNLYNIANTYERMNDLEKAEEYYSKATSIKNYFSYSNNDKIPIYVPYSYMGLAKILLFTGSTEPAREVVEKGLKFGPDIGGLWLIMALSEYKLHNQENALNAADKAKALMPGDMTHYIYTQILNKQSIKLAGYNDSTFWIEP